MGRARLSMGLVLVLSALVQADDLAEPDTDAPPAAPQAEAAADPNDPAAGDPQQLAHVTEVELEPPARLKPADKPAPAAREPSEPEAVPKRHSPAKAAPVALDEPIIKRAADPAEESGGTPPDPQEVAAESRSLLILDTEVPPATATRLSWSPSQSLEGIAAPTPVLVVNGAKPGPILCLTAAIHGDELNGIEIVRRLLYNLDPEKLTGTVIGVPIVNQQGFHRSSRYLADRRDLNRYFPGQPKGSSASRIAYSFFEEVIRHCDALVDLHTGSFHRTNMPQLRGDLRNPQVRELTEGFGNTVVLQSRGASGTLRRAAVAAGIPAVTLEAGESMRLQLRAVEHGVNGITTLMNKMGMIERFKLWGDPEPVYHRSLWVRADQGGILFGEVKLGDSVREGDRLGRVTDPITNISSRIRAPRDGRVIGMALNQVVLPGYAAFHLAFATPKSEMTAADRELEHIEPKGVRYGSTGDEPAPEPLTEEDLMPDEDPDAPAANEDLSEAQDTDDFDE